MMRIRTSGILLASLLVLASCSDEQRPTVGALPDIKEVPAFSFTNYDGQTVTNNDLNGSVYIAYFFFTSCGGPCPVMNSTANVLQAEFSGNEDFRIIGFSVDPDRDNLERLSRYAERYNARPGTWFMTRNTIDEVSKLASKGFMMGDADVPAMHSTRFALVDRSGSIRGYYDGMDEERVKELEAAIEHLLEEKG